MPNANQRLIAQLVRRDGSRCHYCGRQLTQNKSAEYVATGCSIDHVIPISRGGSSDIDNLVLACRQCNGRKRTLSYHEFSLAVQTDTLIQFLMGDYYG